MGVSPQANSLIKIFSLICNCKNVPPEKEWVPALTETVENVCSSLRERICYFDNCISHPPDLYLAT